MDNIRYYTVGAEDIVPSMSSLNDDFSELPSTYTNGTTPDDYAKQWRTGNFNSSHRLECTEVDGARALALCGNFGLRIYRQADAGTSRGYYKYYKIRAWRKHGKMQRCIL